MDFYFSNYQKMFIDMYYGGRVGAGIHVIGQKMLNN